MKNAYGKLAILLPVNAVIMFLLTYALIDRMDHFYPNLNRGYMAVIMVAPMGILMLAMMRKMYPNPRVNVILYAGFAVLFGGAFWMARTQTGVGNETFLRSMIPHHSSAILMCEDASITDPEIVTLCQGIVATQEREIAEMKQILTRYER